MSKEVQEAFKLFDSDQDGLVSREEIIQLIDNLGGDSTSSAAQQLLKAFDENANGCVDLNQFIELWDSFNSKAGEDDDSEEEIRSAFRMYDTNDDGYITKDEMIQAITRMGFVENKEEEAAKCIEEMDLDGDGKVSYAEFLVKWRVS